MAINTEIMSLASGIRISRDPALGATADADIRAGTATLWLVSIDNTANAAQKVYFKLWDVVAPTVGVTAPDCIIPVPGGSVVTMAVIEGLPFTTGLSMACVQTGGTAGAASPTNSVAVAIVYA
jgi:hypothetical protein